MDKYRKLSDLPLNTTPHDGDLIPTIIDNGNGTFRNENIPYSSLKGTPGTNGQGVPTGGTANQVLKKNTATDYDTTWATLDKTSLGLNNVDNTSDINKPVSTAVQAAINSAVATAIAQSKLDTHPIGSLYFNATDNTNPATLLGFGTWVAFGAGRVPVGFDSTQTEFDVLGETGGAKTHTLSITEMPSHTHTQNPHNHTVGGDVNNAAPNISASEASLGPAMAYSKGLNTNSVTATNQNTGGGGAHNNLQPYVVVQIWQRTA